MFYVHFIQYLEFSGTNLLTRCHSASSCFCCFCISAKLYRKYSRNCMGQIASIIKSRNEDCVRRRPERGGGGGPGGQPPPPRGQTRAPPGGGPGPPRAPPPPPPPLFFSFFGR